MLKQLLQTSAIQNCTWQLLKLQPRIETKAIFLNRLASVLQNMQWDKSIDAQMTACIIGKLQVQHHLLK